MFDLSGFFLFFSFWQSILPGNTIGSVRCGFGFGHQVLQSKMSVIVRGDGLPAAARKMMEAWWLAHHTDYPR